MESVAAIQRLNQNRNMKNKNIRKNLFSLKGFTLIELLVVISIIGILATLVITNLNEARARARDASLKQNLVQLKTALRLYYNDYQGYPATGNGLDFNACGINGTSTCDPNTGIFSAGSGPTIYMNHLVMSGSYFEFRYYPCGSGDSFRAKVTLENASDPDITPSQARCPCRYLCRSKFIYGTTDYVVCPD